MNQISFIMWRFYLIICLLLIVVASLMWRVFDLAILDQPFLRRQGDERVLRLIKTPAFRGMIVDRNGYPLAVSTTVYSAWMNPQIFEPRPSSMRLLSSQLGLSQKEMMALYRRYHKTNREFVYLKRSLSPEAANTIKALQIPGIDFQPSYKRFYPEGEVMAHLLGFTNVDDQGQEGLELLYNAWLSGEPGKKRVIKDRLGRIIAEVQTMQEQKSGHHLILSIDKRIQYLAYRELLKGVTENNAHSGSAIVLDVKTGEVLAMVNQPSFNPNKKNHLVDSFRNRAVTDIFEPGSTIKAFTVASVLRDGRYQPDSIINTDPGWIRVGHNILRDERNNGLLTVTQILQKSSNVGITKMITGMPPDHLWNLLHRVGFGEITGVGFPGEQGGVLSKSDLRGAFPFATLAIGYGISITALQLARAYAIIANDGVKLPLSLLRRDEPPEGENVIDKKLANQMLTLLEYVVSKEGTGEMAHVPGYRVAGKTGTAKLVGEQGYSTHRYMSSFVGIAPASNPRLVVAVVIQDPQGKNYHGGQVSGPVFEKIMEGTLRILDIPPDAVLV